MTKRLRVETCDSQTGTDTRGAIVCAIELDANKKAPEWTMIFPASDVDNEIKTRDGRKFRLPSPEKLAAEFNAAGFKAPFDFDHASEMQGGAAIGWVTQLEARAGSVWAKVKWLKAGRDAIESEEFAYVSPAFIVDYDVGEIKSVTSAALTNRPAFKLAAIASTKKDIPMNPELLKLLGLDDKATPEQIADASKKLQAKIAADAEAAKVALEAAKAQHKAELAAAQVSATPSLANFVPRADHDAALARVEVLEKKNAADKELAHKAQVEGEIAEAMKAGKITPATKDFYVQTCATPAGLELFRSFVKAAAVIAPDNVASAAVRVDDSVTITALDLEVAERCGVSKAQLVASMKRPA